MVLHVSINESSQIKPKKKKKEKKEKKEKKKREKKEKIERANSGLACLGTACNLET